MKTALLAILTLAVLAIANTLRFKVHGAGYDAYFRRTDPYYGD